MLIHLMFLISAGRLFHTLGAAALNDLSPKVAKKGRTSVILSCDRRQYLVGCLTVIRSIMYCGELP